jgi:predicted Rossmann-fold nucleotide-binding protein
MRKMHLAMRANALAVFPGGFGTFDELFELLTLVQTSKASPRPIVLYGRAFWEKAVNFPFLVDQGMIDERDLSLFEIVDSPEEAWVSLLRRGLQAAPVAAAPERPVTLRHRRRPAAERMPAPVPEKPEG